MMQTNSANGALKKNEVRMAYVINKEDLGKALKVLAEALKVYPGRTENTTK